MSHWNFVNDGLPPGLAFMPPGPSVSQGEDSGTIAIILAKPGIRLIPVGIVFPWNLLGRCMAAMAIPPQGTPARYILGALLLRWGQGAEAVTRRKGRLDPGGLLECLVAPELKDLAGCPCTLADGVPDGIRAHADCFPPGSRTGHRGLDRGGIKTQVRRAGAGGGWGRSAARPGGRTRRQGRHGEQGGHQNQQGQGQGPCPMIRAGPGPSPKGRGAVGQQPRYPEQGDWRGDGPKDRGRTRGAVTA
jgi:hypothetical protein